MKIYTSYFARGKHLKQAGIVPVSISLKSPRWFKGEEVKELAPTYPILQLGRSGDTAGYTTKFRELLEAQDKQQILDDLKFISEQNGNQDVAICCYEKVTDFCHRHIVADWLNESLDDADKIKEFGATKQYAGLMMVQKSFWH